MSSVGLNVTENHSKWVLMWEDDFNGTAGAAPNPEYWTCEIGGGGWGNEEWQFYTSSPNNVSLNGEGALAITAREQSLDEDCWYGKCRYTSSRITTQGKVSFTYGKVEARVRFPSGQGIWPAVWMLGADFSTSGWPNCGEIDIVENLGHEMHTIYGTVHGPDYYAHEGMGASLTVSENLADDYHVYSVIWDHDSIEWWFDDRRYHRVDMQSVRTKKWVFDHNFYLIINLAIGGRWPGYPDAKTTFPQTLFVAWVRVYQNR